VIRLDEVVDLDEPIPFIPTKRPTPLSLTPEEIDQVLDEVVELNVAAHSAPCSLLNCSTTPTFMVSSPDGDWPACTAHLSARVATELACWPDRPDAVRVTWA